MRSAAGIPVLQGVEDVKSPCGWMRETTAMSDWEDLCLTA